MNDLGFLDKYFGYYKRNLLQREVKENILKMRDMIIRAKEKQGKLILAGNGGSAAIAGHGALDFTQQTGIRAMNFNESSLITALANDFGYENWIARALASYADVNDIIILISSSGQSANVINGAKAAKEKKLPVITFTGFAKDNPLKQLGDLNFWLDSKAYNIIECTHLIWLTAVIDLIVGKVEYPVR